MVIDFGDENLKIIGMHNVSKKDIFTSNSKSQNARTFVQNLQKLGDHWANTDAGSHSTNTT